MKKNYGIDMQGPFRIQRVASLPVWGADDLGREVYLTTNNKKYRGNNSAWAEADVDKIWTSLDTAPTGWSIMAGTTDALLATKGGSNAYNTAGGAQAGTWTQPTHTHTGPSHTHTGGSHTLLTSEMPAHDHEYNINSYSPGPGSGHGTPYYGAVGYQRNTFSTGGGGVHDHGATSAAGTGATGANATATTYRPTANVGILIERT